MNTVKTFDFTKMTALDVADWTIQVGEKWANKERQQYVNDPNNLFFRDGLVLRATSEDGIIKSARINTKDKFAFQYGRVEIEAQLPTGKGTWPALWMMSNDSRYGHWPRSGEIDIMEHVGNKPNELLTCLHTWAYNHRRGGEQYYHAHTIPGLTEGFHTYGIDWDAESITYLLDGRELVRYVKGERGKDTSWEGWPFDHPFYLIVNLAIGGTLGGDVDPDMFPQEFIIRKITIQQ